MDPLIQILSIGTLILDVFLLVSIPLLLWNRYSSKIKLLEKADTFFEDKWKVLGFLLASIATTGSLYASNILGWTPCHLCWYQRILMYPMALIFGISTILDTDVVEYVVPLATIGAGVSGYHYIIQRLEQFSSAGCSVTSVSCDTEYTFYLGIVTLPLMAFTAFVGILLISQRYEDSM